MVLTRKYVYHPYQVYQGAEVHVVHVLFAYSHFLGVHFLLWQACFRVLKINGNENSKVFDRRMKPFHQIVLLQTMHPVHGTVGVFTVSDQTTRNNKVGYMSIWTEYRTHKIKTILGITDFFTVRCICSALESSLCTKPQIKIMEEFSI